MYPDAATLIESSMSFLLAVTYLLYQVLYSRPQQGPQKSLPNTDIDEFSRSILADGVERVLSYDGTGQYNRDGTGGSACGLAALNFARIVFSMEQGGLKNTDLLQAVLARECAEKTTAICALWSGNLHLDVEDICRIPLFEKTLKLKTTTRGHPEVSFFESLLMELNNLDLSAVAIITRPPEMIACLKLRLTPRSVFIIFNPLPRPSYPNGAGMIVNTSIEGTARRLRELLPNVNLPDGFDQSQAQLLSTYSGHVFVPHDVETSTPALWQTVLESSLAQLSMQVEISELQSQIESLKNEQQRLESEIKEADARSRRPSYFSSLTRHTSRPSSSKAFTFTLNPFSISALNPFRPGSLSATKSSSGRAPGRPGRATRAPTQPSDREDSILHAMRLQHEFDNENRTLSAQRADLFKFTQRLFVCGICLEEMPDDSIARPDPCGHTFCRECLRGHVTARLNERRFPILCPTCTASKGKGKGVVGEVSQFLALNLGLTDKQYSIWTEIEMNEFSVPLNCRKCQRMMFVARDEHEEAKIIVCPLPDCDHAWCKQCQQSIDFNGPKHSCDGTSELDHLMKQQGWKYCPTCKTPIQKISGCNHMSCLTPACNTHFCYICGDLIVKSALTQEIREAKSAHYNKNCQLFEVPAE